MLINAELAQSLSPDELRFGVALTLLTDRVNSGLAIYPLTVTPILVIYSLHREAWQVALAVVLVFVTALLVRGVMILWATARARRLVGDITVGRGFLSAIRRFQEGHPDMPPVLVRRFAYLGWTTLFRGR
ncbi:hypothetical protein OP10G_0015 [Fimbriimonas ginsengisoli Gsoil 348]|uniref:Uncharacterized protein n=1 Tax=Fimbriimonas ginsengisoli Gsoil 348 TaxID=661478 RepID=A0A068NIE0_FIMGI|nr:hypothetical protein OP10G_0015 [Fimbriimonas ginsengisoli Gsoil 348]